MFFLEGWLVLYFELGYTPLFGLIITQGLHLPALNYATGEQVVHTLEDTTRTRKRDNAAVGSSINVKQT